MRFNRGHRAVLRLVRAGTGTDVEDSPCITKRDPDHASNARVRTTKIRIALADRAIIGVAGTAVLMTRRFVLHRGSYSILSDTFLTIV